MNAKVIMQLINVSKTYAMGEVTVEALKKSSLDIFAGELVVILGPAVRAKVPC
jgi:putative ABC transport system ATP-binding protein